MESKRDQQRISDELLSLLDKYAAIDRPRGDSRYTDAIKSLLAFHSRLGHDSSTLEIAIDQLIGDFELKQTTIVELLNQHLYDDLRVASRELQSSIRHIVSRDIIEKAEEMELASAAHDIHRTHAAWSSLLTKLYPVFFLMRQLRPGTTNTKKE